MRRLIPLFLCVSIAALGSAVRMRVVGQVVDRSIYPGIDFVIHGDRNPLEYDFRLAPGAEPNRIELAFEGGGRPEIDARGDLILHAGQTRDSSDEANRVPDGEWPAARSGRELPTRPSRARPLSPRRVRYESRSGDRSDAAVRQPIRSTIFVRERDRARYPREHLCRGPNHSSSGWIGRRHLREQVESHGNPINLLDQLRREQRHATRFPVSRWIPPAAHN